MVSNYIQAKKLSPAGKPTSFLFNSQEFMGIELEYEGMDLSVVSQAFADSRRIRVIQDHSLKHKGVELIFRQAMCGDLVVKALDEVFNALKAKKQEPYLKGNRCSTHVHINVTDLTVPELKNFILFSYLCEPALLDTCSKDRRHNSFTVGIERTRDFDWILANIQDNNLQFNVDMAKYRAIGLNSLYSLGSLEFRMFNGSCDQGQILDWINFIQEIKHIATTRGDMRQLVLSIMRSDPETVLNAVFKRKIKLSSHAVEAMWNYVRDFYSASASEGIPLQNTFSSFYKKVGGK